MRTDSPTTATPRTQDTHPGGANSPAIVPELLTTKQAAALCGISERTLWGWSRSGLAPRPVFIGRGHRPACRYRRTEILRWIENGCQPIDGRAIA